MILSFMNAPRTSLHFAPSLRNLIVPSPAGDPKGLDVRWGKRTRDRRAGRTAMSQRPQQLRAGLEKPTPISIASMIGSAAHVVASMFPPIVAPAGSRCVGNTCARRGADQPAGKCGTSRPAGQATDKRAAATADQCTAENSISPGAARTAGECQSHRNHDQGAVHLVLLCGPYSLRAPSLFRRDRNWHHRNCLTEERARRQMNTVAV